MEKKQVFSKPFNLVYEKDYPNLFIGPGIFSNYDLAKGYSPNDWINKKTTDIEKYRSKQIFSFKSVHKEDTRNPNKELQELQLLAQSTKTTELEIDLEKTPKMIKEKISGINNFSYELENIKIIDNIKIPKIIDKVVTDTDLKAREGIINLNKKLQDVYKIEQILSAGLLGQKNKRILVPTRWAITSVDDIVSKDIVNNIKSNPLIDKYLVFCYEFYNNKFYILFIPRNWGFEQIEEQNNSFCIDYEINEPRKIYADSVTGAYYASRLEVGKYLDKIKKQATVIVFREIEQSYFSKGVWVIREAVRLALENEPFIFEDLESSLNFIDSLGIRNGINYWKEKSFILKEIRCQKRLGDFFKT